MPTDKDRTTLALLPHVREEVEKRSARVAGGLALSLAANGALSRYFALMNAGRKSVSEKLNDAEFHLLCDICNGTLFEPLYFGMLGADAEDAEDGYFEKWGVNRQGLLAKLGALSWGEELALIDAVEEFWRGGGGNSLPE